MAQCSCNNGTVYDDCPRCQGSGQVLGFNDAGEETLTDCPRCGGSGTVENTCPVCHGTGEV